MPIPSYIDLHHRGILQERIDKALLRLRNCDLCPRECGVDRTRSELGFCRTGRYARVASNSPHFGEEAPLVGRFGSGTIFFSSCNLLCSFCQNYDISHLHQGVEVSPQQIASMMLALMEQGCHNINFVTPSHVVPQILEALPIAIEHGLNVPLVYNTGSYDKVNTLKLLDGIFDIYMPDFKFWDEKWAQRFCQAPDYSRVARKAIIEMHSQVGDLELDDRGIAKKGLLVRHLVMPNNITNTSEITHFLAKRISENTYVNIMDQYRPCFKARDDELINRGISSDEYIQAVRDAIAAGIHRLDKKAGLF